MTGFPAYFFQTPTVFSSVPGRVKSTPFPARIVSGSARRSLQAFLPSSELGTV